MILVAGLVLISVITSPVLVFGDAVLEWHHEPAFGYKEDGASGLGALVMGKLFSGGSLIQEWFVVHYGPDWLGMDYMECIDPNNQKWKELIGVPLYASKTRQPIEIDHAWQCEVWYAPGPQNPENPRYAIYPLGSSANWYHGRDQETHANDYLYPAGNYRQFPVYGDLYIQFGQDASGNPIFQKVCYNELWDNIKNKPIPAAAPIQSKTVVDGYYYQNKQELGQPKPAVDITYNYAFSLGPEFCPTIELIIEAPEIVNCGDYSIKFRVWETKKTLWALESPWIPIRDCVEGWTGMPGDCRVQYKFQQCCKMYTVEPDVMDAGFEYYSWDFLIYDHLLGCVVYRPPGAILDARYCNVDEQSIFRGDSTWDCSYWHTLSCLEDPEEEEDGIPYPFIDDENRNDDDPDYTEDAPSENPLDDFPPEYPHIWDDSDYGAETVGEYDDERGLTQQGLADALDDWAKRYRMADLDHLEYDDDLDIELNKMGESFGALRAQVNDITTLKDSIAKLDFKIGKPVFVKKYSIEIPFGRYGNATMDLSRYSDIITAVRYFFLVVFYIVAISTLVGEIRRIAVAMGA